GRHLVMRVSQQLVHREPGNLAENVPEGELHEPDRGAEVRPEVPQGTGMLLDPERVLADEVRRDALHRLLLSAVELVARDAVQPRVGVDANVAKTDPRLLGAGRPRGEEGHRQLYVDLSRADLRDAHALPCQFRSGRPEGIQAVRFGPTARDRTLGSILGQRLLAS